MKTGFTCSAGYNIVASATREGKRLIAIVLGEVTRSKRNARAAALLERGFQTLASGNASPGTTIESLPTESYDHESVRAANLDKRFKDCLDPEPTLASSGSGAKLGTATKSPSAVSAKRKPEAKSARRLVAKRHQDSGSSDSADD